MLTKRDKNPQKRNYKTCKSASSRRLHTSQFYKKYLDSMTRHVNPHEVGSDIIHSSMKIHELPDTKCKPTKVKDTNITEVCNHHQITAY